MKKIKDITQLQIEREAIQNEKNLLEQKIQSEWTGLKQSMNPSEIVSQSFSGPLAQKTQELIQDDSIIKSVLTYGLALVGKKIADKLVDKIKSNAHQKNADDLDIQ